LGCKIGAGSFGEVYIGTDLRSGQEVAVKLEPVAAKAPRLLYEAKLCQLLAGVTGVPRVHWYGVDGAYAVMVLDLLGPSLQDLLRFCRGRFGLKTMLMLADQVLGRIEQVHARDIVHRDIKPDNFVIGLRAKANLVHIIDFGLSKRYRDPQTQQHVPYRDGIGLVGTARFASVNAHLGIEQSRRDDLEAAGYMLIFLGRGNLPWQKIRAPSSKAKHKLIMESKVSTPFDVLCEGFPTEFTTYLEYCRGLSFQERPDYAYLRRLLQSVFVREDFRFDINFDWTIEALHGTELPTEECAKQEREAEVHAVVANPLLETPLVEVLVA